MEIKNIEYITKTVKIITFKKIKTVKKIIPGQFINIRKIEKNNHKKNYTIKKKKNTIKIICNYHLKGKTSKKLFELKPKNKIEISGTFGKFILNKNVKQKYIFIVNGTGFIPFLALKERIEKILFFEIKIKIFIGHRSIKQKIFKNYIEKIKKQYNKNFYFLYSLGSKKKITYKTRLI